MASATSKIYLCPDSLSGQLSPLGSTLLALGPWRSCWRGDLGDGSWLDGLQRIRSHGSAARTITQQWPSGHDSPQELVRTHSHSPSREDMGCLRVAEYSRYCTKYQIQCAALHGALRLSPSDTKPHVRRLPARECPSLRDNVRTNGFLKGVASTITQRRLARKSTSRIACPGRLSSHLSAGGPGSCSTNAADGFPARPVTAEPGVQPTNLLRKLSTTPGIL